MSLKWDTEACVDSVAILQGLMKAGTACNSKHEYIHIHVAYKKNGPQMQTVSAAMEIQCHELSHGFLGALPHVHTLLAFIKVCRCARNSSHSIIY